MRTGRRRLLTRSARTDAADTAAARRLLELEARALALERARAHPRVVLRTPSELRAMRRRQRRAWYAGG